MPNLGPLHPQIVHFVVALHPAPDNPRLVVRIRMLMADSYVALGEADSANVVPRRLVAQFPMFQRLKDRMAELGG